MLKDYLFKKIKKMKIFSYVIILLSLLSIIFNATKLNFDNLFQGESTVALIGIVAALCAIIVVLLYKTAKKVDEKTK